MPSPVTDILVGLRLSNSVRLLGTLLSGGPEATGWFSDFYNFHSYLVLYLYCNSVLAQMEPPRWNPPDLFPHLARVCFKTARLIRTLYVK
jgi:hypothetical protein